MPPALRRAQGSFKSAVEDSVPAIATVIVGMLQVEIEIRRTRKRKDFEGWIVQLVPERGPSFG